MSLLYLSLTITILCSCCDHRPKKASDTLAHNTLLKNYGVLESRCYCLTVSSPTLELKRNSL